MDILIPQERLVAAAPGAASLTPEEAEACLGVALHPQVRAFLEQTQGARALRGGLQVRGAASLSGPGLPLPIWGARFGGESFPAIGVGSDGLGHEFWVHAESARVISIHHDSLDERLAGRRLPADKSAAAEAVLVDTSAIELAQLLSLHWALDGAGDDPAAVVHAACDALDLSVSQACAAMERAPLMFLWVRARDLLEGGGAAGLQGVRDTLAKLREDPRAFARKRSLDLSQAALHRLPEALGSLKGVTKLDLSANPALDLPAAVAALSALSKLKDLSLAGCRCRALPEALGELTALKKLDLSGNPLASLPALASLTALEQLDLRDTPIDDPALAAAFREAHPSCAVIFARSPYPMGLGRAMADPEGARVIDLSIKPHDDEAQLEEMPDLSRFPKLEVLRLTFQRKLQLSDALAAARGLTLREMNLRGLRLGRDDIEDALLGLGAQPALEVFETGGFAYQALPTGALMAYAAATPSLRSLRCNRSRRWTEAMPETSLEELLVFDLTQGAEALPEGTGRQAELQTLRLEGYEFDLPPDLPSAPKLTSVELTKGAKQLQRLGDCVGLQALTMRDMRLKESLDLGQLIALNTLALTDLSGESVGLVAQLGGLSALQTLSLERVSFDTEALGAIWELPELRSLVIRCQREREAPEGLARLAQLEELTLQGVAPASPSDLHLKALKRLHGNFEGEGADARLAAIAENRGLEVLDHHDFSLLALPASLGRLTELNTLRLKTWRQLNLDAQPDVFGALKKVEVLEISGTHATRLPEGVGEMPLRELHLNNQEHLDWAQVFTLLAQIPTLRKLRVCWGRMVSVPPEVGLLTQLDELVVHQSGTTSVAKEIKGLAQLWRLQVTACKWPGAERRRVRKALPGCEVVSW